MAQTFHCFARLPAEVQRMIWRAAICDRKGRHKHFLAVYPAGSESFDNCQSVRFGPWAGSSWADDRHSGSMADSGLWYACWASYCEMRRRFPAPRQPDRGNDGAGHSDHDWTPVTGLTADQCGVTRRYTFVPSRDLFVLDNAESFIAAFKDPDRSIDCVSDVPALGPPGSAHTTLLNYFGHRLPSATAPTERALRPVKLRDLRSIAIPLDFQWRLGEGTRAFLDEANEIMDAIVSVASQLPSSTTIYLFNELPGNFLETAVHLPACCGRDKENYEKFYGQQSYFAINRHCETISWAYSTACERAMRIMLMRRCIFQVREARDPGLGARFCMLNLGYHY